MTARQPEFPQNGGKAQAHFCVPNVQTKAQCGPQIVVFAPKPFQTGSGVFAAQVGVVLCGLAEKIH